MKRMLGFFISVFSALVLFGCDAEVQVETKLSELEQAMHTKEAIISIEVPSCTSHEDSRQPSDSLVKQQQQMPNVFTGSNFKECYTKNFNSYALFNIPVGVGKVNRDTAFANDINIIMQQDKAIMVQATNNFHRRYGAFLKNNMISDLRLILKVGFMNDSKYELTLNVYSAFVDGYPVTIGTTSIAANKMSIFTLSDVSSTILTMENRAEDRALFAAIPLLSDTK